MNTAVLSNLLERIKTVKICVIGDVCLDIYWEADMTKSCLSRETPHFPLPVVRERDSLGGGGNVMANVAALGAGVLPVSVLGNDWRGYLTRELIGAIGADGPGLITDETRLTPCYAKPLRKGISNVVYEDPRLDFENYSRLSAETVDRLLRALEEAAEHADIIAVCDQLACGVVAPAVRERLCALAKTVPVVVDSRDRISLYTNAIVKPNAVEAAAAANEADPAAAARILSAKTGAPVIVTLEDEGALWCENGALTHIPGVKVPGPVDPVGAGDAFLAAFCAAFAAGASPADAVSFANLAAAVTVKKIGTTGTAEPNEIIMMNDER